MAFNNKINKKINKVWQVGPPLAIPPFIISDLLGRGRQLTSESMPAYQSLRQSLRGR